MRYWRSQGAAFLIFGVTERSTRTASCGIPMALSRRCATAGTWRKGGRPARCTDSIYRPTKRDGHCDERQGCGGDKKRQCSIEPRPEAVKATIDAGLPMALGGPNAENVGRESGTPTQMKCYDVKQCSAGGSAGAFVHGCRRVVCAAHRHL